ncbi:hypothetical protein ACFLUG_04780 [Chloroflexota bacterium]
MPSREKINVFTSLGKYNSASDENYLTESFIFLINFLMLCDRPIGIGIINRLCTHGNDFCFDLNENISISTQETTEEGTPDIKISSPDKLIYIEVKHDSPLGNRQISRYKTALESSMADIKHVVLLTRFAIDIEEQKERPYKHIRWFQVYNWLTEVKDKSNDPICVYLINAFRYFLEGKQMSLQRVGWEYINGVPAFNNLLNMLEVAIQGSSIPVYSKSAGWDYKGFWLDDKKYISVIHYDNHLVITFEIADKTKYDKNLVQNKQYELREGKERFWFRLPLDEKYFFSLDKDKQLEEITNFVRIAHSNAELMKVK